MVCGVQLRRIVLHYYSLRVCYLLIFASGKHRAVVSVVSHSVEPVLFARCHYFVRLFLFIICSIFVRLHRTNL